MKSVAHDLAVQNGNAQGVIGFFHFSRQAPFETGQQAVVDADDVLWGTVASDDQLFAVLVKVVEDVEKYVLSTGLAAQFVNIVDQQNIDALIKVYEIVDSVV